MALNLNMAKAYDRIEWKFLEAIMRKLGFCDIWIKWIMQCATIVSFSFNLNGNKVGFIRPNRGIRQGTLFFPIFSYLVLKGFLVF